MTFKMRPKLFTELVVILVSLSLVSDLGFAQQLESQSLSWMTKGKSKISAAAWQKLPPKIRMLVGAPEEFLKMKTKTMAVTGIETVEPAIGLIVKCKGSQEELESIGAKVDSRIGDIYTIRIPIDRLGELANLANVSSIAPSMKCSPELDLSIVESRANLVHQGNYGTKPPTYSGYTGKSVLVVTIDTGIDWKHGDFINDSNGSSRILFIWDQNLVMQNGENHPAGFTYGVEYTQADINDEIDGSPTNYIRSKDTDGHGTHLMGIIAGDGSATGGGMSAYSYVGMAPQADLLVVNTSFYTADIIDGIAYAMQKADLLGKPAVINLSIGHQYGAHDGTDLFEQAIDIAANTGKVIVVKSAGNEGTNASYGEYIHAEGTVKSASSFAIKFNVPSYTANSSTYNDYIECELWYQGGDNINVKITSPNGYSYNANTGSNNNNQAISTSDGAIFIDNAAGGIDPNNGDRLCYIFIFDYYSYYPPKTGTWTITVTGNSITESGHFDSWIAYSQVGNKQVFFTATSGSNKENISIPGNAFEVITVGAHSTKTSWVDFGGTTRNLTGAVLNDHAYFSSAGPTRDDPGFILGRQKPDISASGFGVIAARSADASWTTTSSTRNKDGVHLMMAGTSMAAPHVAGAIALMLEKDPSLNAQQVKTILNNAARTDAFTGTVPNNLWGYGKLAIDKAMQQIQLPQLAVNLSPAMITNDEIAGNTAAYKFKIKNLGAAVDNYKLSISGNVWPTTFWNASGTSQISTTGPIASHAVYEFLVRVQIPAGTAPSSSDDATIYATSQANATIQHQADILTRTPAEIPWSDTFSNPILDIIKWNFNGGPAEINSVGLNEPSLPYSLNLNGADKGGDEVQSQAINLVGKNNVGLSYCYQRMGGGNSPESGEDLWVDYLNSSGKWINLMHYLGDGPDMTTYTKELIFLPADAYHSFFKIRFRNFGTVGPNDDWFIDDVLIDVVPTPNIVVSPISFEVTLGLDDSAKRTLTIENTGDAKLMFDIQRELVGATNILVNSTSNTPVVNIESVNLAHFGPDGTIDDWQGNETMEAGETDDWVSIQKSRIYPILPDNQTTGSSGSISNKFLSVTYLAEDFEDGNYNGWLDAGYANTKEVTNLTAANNTKYSLRIYNASVSSTHFCGLYRNFDNIQPGYVSFYVRSGSTASSDGYFVLDSPSQRGSTDPYGVIFFYAKNTGYLYVNDSQTVPYTANTWYHIEFKDIDWNTKTFDYYVNGSLKAENLPFRNAANATRIEKLQLYNYNLYSQAWWDEIVIGDSEQNTPAWLSFEPSSGNIPPLGSEAILLTIRTKGLAPDTTYRANLIIKSNDPDEPVVTIPVALNIREGIPIWAPDTSGYANTTINLPIYVQDVTNQGIYSAGLTVRTISSVLTPIGVTTADAISQGWGTPTYTIFGGEINIAMAGSSALIGDGKQVLIYIRYQVGTNSGDSTDIELLKATFNKGQPKADPMNGKFKILSNFEIAGNVSYFYGNMPIAQTLMSLIGPLSISTNTDANGNYLLANIPGGDYYLKPGKTGAVGNAITAFDAATIMRYYIGELTLNPYQKKAGDVSGNGAVTPYDASWILRYCVGEITQFPVRKDWTFIPTSFSIDDTNWPTAPDSLSYAPLNNNAINQNFWGLVHGDVTGNWQPVSMKQLARSDEDIISISVGEIMRSENDIMIPVSVDKSGLLSAMFSLKFNPSVLKASSVTTSEAMAEYTSAFKIEADRINVALAGAHATVKAGAIVNIHFQLMTDNNDAVSPLDFSDVFLNEGNMTNYASNGTFSLKSLLPIKYGLSQNYPNPFNPETFIHYQLPEKGTVVLKIYNTIGQEVRNLLNGEKEAGYYEIKWDGKDNFGQLLPSGVYLAQMQVGKFRATKKMVMLK